MSTNILAVIQSEQVEEPTVGVAERTVSVWIFIKAYKVKSRELIGVFSSVLPVIPEE